jgi:hypothetical protein
MVISPQLYKKIWQHIKKLKVIGMECFSFGVFRRAVSGLYYSYIYLTNIIQIQDKFIINYAIQTQYQRNINLKFKIFLNS